MYLLPGLKEQIRTSKQVSVRDAHQSEVQAVIVKQAREKVYSRTGEYTGPLGNDRSEQQKSERARHRHFGEHCRQGGEMAADAG